VSVLCGVFNYEAAESQEQLAAALAPATGAARSRVSWYRDHAVILGTVGHGDESHSAEGASDDRADAGSQGSEVVTFLVGESFPSVRRPGPRTDLGSLYRASGVAAFAELNGTWALALWDRSRRELVLARDPAGVNRLFVFRKGRALYFSTSLRLFSVLGAGLDLDAAAEFLRYLYVPAPRALLSGVRSLVPGQALVVDAKGERELCYARPYWETLKEPRPRETGDLTLQEALPRFETALSTAVRRRIPEQGRTAILLSGGKDSTCLAIAASRLAPERFQTLSIGFQDAKTDETRYARDVAQILGLRHRSVGFGSAEYCAALPEAARLMEQPFGDPSYLPVLLALRTMDHTDTVVFDGSGNDLYFEFPATPQEIALSRLQQTLPDGLRRRLPVSWLRGSRYFETAWILSQPSSELFVRSTWRAWGFDELERLLGHRMDIRATAFSRAWSEYGHLGPTAVKLAINSLQEPEGEFRRTVQSALVDGKLARFPFTDIDLCEFIGGLQPSLKLSAGVYKPLLLALMRKYLPGSLVDRGKGYFTNDLNPVLKHNRYQLLNEYLSAESLRATGRFDPVLVRMRVAEYVAGDETSRVVKSLYALILLQIWLLGLEADR
jgi:asparagine synthase (glutamine-hydrolysing)